MIDWMSLSGIKSWWKAQNTILNLNQRNVAFILEENDRKLYPWVDNKRKTKEILARFDLPTPPLIGIFSTHRQVSTLGSCLQQVQAFAAKPAQGSGGDGIMVIAAKTSRGYRKASGQVISPEDMAFHMHNILNGLHSLGGQEDEVILEALIRSRPIIPNLSSIGVPDVRVLLYRGIPVAAMLRLPTYESDGKANLHMGGIGVGINIATGETLAAMHQNRFIEEHPEFDIPLLGHRIPDWDNVLAIATRVYEAIPLSYMGVDMVLDERLGPLILEANARPGISIQLANRKGLLPRLERVQRGPVPETVEDRIVFARTHFYG